MHRLLRCVLVLAVLSAVGLGAQENDRGDGEGWLGQDLPFFADGFLGISVATGGGDPNAGGSSVASLDPFLEALVTLRPGFTVAGGYKITDGAGIGLEAGLYGGTVRVNGSLVGESYDLPIRVIGRFNLDRSFVLKPHLGVYLLNDVLNSVSSTFLEIGFSTANKVLLDLFSWRLDVSVLIGLSAGDTYSPLPRTAVLRLGLAVGAAFN